LMREICMSGSMSGERKRSDAAWPKQPRLSSTLPRTGQLKWACKRCFRIKGQVCAIFGPMHRSKRAHSITSSVRASSVGNRRERVGPALGDDFLRRAQVPSIAALQSTVFNPTSSVAASPDPSTHSARKVTTVQRSAINARASHSMTSSARGCLPLRAHQPRGPRGRGGELVVVIGRKGAPHAPPS